MPPVTAARDDAPLPADLAPEHFLERVDRTTGERLDGPIEPRELLIDSHRDGHPVDVHARFMMSRVVRATGSEAEAVRRMRRMRSLGRNIAAVLARTAGRRNPEPISKALFGLHARRSSFRFRQLELSREARERRGAELREQAAAQLARATHDDRGLTVLLTGGSGFIGKELLWRAARDPGIAEMILLLRPRQLFDRDTGELLETHDAARRGEELLAELDIDPQGDAGRFTFLAGDIEAPSFGLSPAQVDTLARRVTHVIHCAASVAFDASYADSVHANVLGNRHSLELSQRLQEAPGSPFVAHLAIETSYIHGRQGRDVARESEVRFPAHYYNNYYELTKAMASLETERRTLRHGLRVVQLCPTIVIGESHTGNNRGDTKVVNAPVNLFGRSASPPAGGGLAARSRAAMLARLARVFPGDPTARLNLIPVDRVALGILAALRKPRAVGRRIHLANDRLITAAQLAATVVEELEVEVRLVDPTLHRTVGLPLVGRMLQRAGQSRAARTLRKMSSVFGGYAEWGQPRHEVGNDIRLLGLPPERPDPRLAFRMLCRHNRYVQEFGRIKDPGQLARRERSWRSFVEALEELHGCAAAELDAESFRAAVATWDAAAAG